MICDGATEEEESCPARCSPHDLSACHRGDQHTRSAQLQNGAMKHPSPPARSDTGTASPVRPAASPLRPLAVICDLPRESSGSMRPSSDAGEESSASSAGSTDGRQGGEGRLSPSQRGGTHSGGGGGGEEPPVSPARQLSKLKRFLATLQQLGADISADIGDRVHSLVLALVNRTVSIEEFHDQLHKTTNFPLRPFVVPFLKASLPILQDELEVLAQQAHMSPRQFLLHHEHMLFDVQPSPSADSPTLPRDPRPTLPRPALNNNGKRPYPSENDTNGLHHGDVTRPAKSSRLVSPGGAESVTSSAARGTGMWGGSGVRPIRLQDISSSRLLREQLERERLMQDRDRYFSIYSFQKPEVNHDRLERREDEWKHLENILHCIAGMVERCQRALVGLQERTRHSDLSLIMRCRPLDGGLSATGGLGIDIKRDLMATGLRQTDEQRLDLMHKAEEAMKEVKRQAIAQLQQAVAAAESKANDILAVDRVQMERALEDVRERTRDEVTALIGRQEESKENCWNCGRLASETCSGCKEARYCGSFCQHRHWETHHRVCGRAAGVTGTAVAPPGGRPGAPGAVSYPKRGDAPSLAAIASCSGKELTRGSLAAAVASKSKTDIVIPVIKQEKL